MSPSDDDRSPGSATGPVDLTVLAQLRTALADDSLVVQIIEAFLADTPPRLDTIDQAAQGSDQQTVARQAHGVKGAALTLGLVDLAAVCDQLEASGSGHAPTPLGLVRSVRHAYAAGSEALREYLTHLR